MENQVIRSDSLHAYLSGKIGEGEFANLVIEKIQKGDFCEALKWVYPIVVSQLDRNPHDTRWRGQEELFDGYYKRVRWRPTRFSEWKPVPFVRAIDIAAQSIEPQDNVPAIKMAKLVLFNVYEKHWGPSEIVCVAREHLEDVLGIPKEACAFFEDGFSEGRMISEYIRGKTGARLVRKIVSSSHPGRYARALSLIMPLADHIITCLEKGEHVLGRQGFMRDGIPMIDVRYFHPEKQFRPWDALCKDNKNAAHAILIGLTSLDIASGFDSKSGAWNPNFGTPAGKRIYLALNMLACLVPCDQRKTGAYSKGYVCQDFLQAAGSYFESHRHLPRPAKFRACFQCRF